jgi:DNA-binding CsgD family transcriptional regulator
MAHGRVGLDSQHRAKRLVRMRAVSSRPSSTGQLLVVPKQMLALFAAMDLDALIDAAFQVLHATVACDFVSALYRNVGDGLLKERDSLGRTYGPVFMRRYGELTPAIPLARANPGIKLLTTRHAITLQETALRRTPFFREVMRPQGWRHGVALCFWTVPPGDMPVFVTSVYRREEQPDFSEQDVDKLQSIHAFIDCAVGRKYEREAAAMALEGAAVTTPTGGTGFAILDRHFLLIEANATAREFCHLWANNSNAAALASSAGEWCLPLDLAAECLKMEHEWQSHLRANTDAAGDTRRFRRVMHSKIVGLTASITMMCPKSSGLADPVFVLELDRRVHGIALDTPRETSALLRGLTKAERRVAMVLADGFSNQAIADHLGKTVYAVKFLLHRIYQKTGVPNRAALVAVLRSRRSHSTKRARN